MIVLVAHEDAFARSSHSMCSVMLFQSAQARQHAGVLLWLVLLGAKGVVFQRV